jgi:hypothetical protein
LPAGEFILRSETDATVLIHAGRVATVPIGCEQLVAELDGSLTLREVERRYGDVGVNWIGALHQEGMVRWASTQDRAGATRS